jgi:hypothetical protein
VSSPEPADVIDAMKMHRIRLSKDQGLRPWEPANIASRKRSVVDGFTNPSHPIIN